MSLRCSTLNITFLLSQKLEYIPHYAPSAFPPFRPLSKEGSTAMVMATDDDSDSRPRLRQWGGGKLRPFIFTCAGDYPIPPQLYAFALVGFGTSTVMRTRKKKRDKPVGEDFPQEEKNACSFFVQFCSLGFRINTPPPYLGLQKKNRWWRVD